MFDGVLTKIVLLWIPMVFIAIANGILREKTYGARMSELAAHQVSTGTGVIAMGIYIGATGFLWPFASLSGAAAAGGIWLIMTIAFEFLFGHFVAGHSWRRLVQDYDLRRGRVWLVFLSFLVVAPVLFYLLGARPTP